MNTRLVMTRRRLLGIFVLALAASVMMAAAALRTRLRDLALGATNLVWTPRRRLLAHFAYLDLDPSGVDAYVRDYAEQVGPLWRDIGPPNLYMRYLLSTDFFTNGADESRRVLYVGLYNPPFSACVNPFARFADVA